MGGTVPHGSDSSFGECWPRGTTPFNPPPRSKLREQCWAGALAALSGLSSSDFIALVALLVALLGVIAVVRGNGDAHGRPGSGSGMTRPGP